MKTLMLIVSSLAMISSVQGTTTIPKGPSTCPSGYYLKVIDTTTQAQQCTICPAGSRCPSTTSIAACASGTYSLPGQTTCTTCPSGFICPSTTSGPQMCPQGTQPSADKLTCTTCVAGTACLTPDTSSQTCTAPTLFSSSSGSAECFSCPAGQSCTSTASTACATGTSAFGTGVCVNSAAGFFQPNTYMAQEKCPSGTYQTLTGQGTCNLCDAGKSCSLTNPGSAPVACGTRTFSPLGVSQCTTCLPGHECTDTTTASQVPCLDGYYQDATTGLCTQCPPGKLCSETAALSLTAAAALGITCPKGYWPSGKGCEALAPKTAFVDGQTTYTMCTASQYVPSPGAACTACPAGMACSLKPCTGASVDPGTCTPCDDTLNTVCTETSIDIFPRQCPLGYYSTSGLCQICPEGSACPDSQAAVACAAKTYSGLGFTACLPCPAGYDCSTSKKLSEIKQCAQGTYSKLGDGACTDCAPGQSCPSPDLDKDLCIAGTFQKDSKKDTPCTICPANSECKTDGLQADSKCPTKKYAAPGTGADGCLDCPNMGNSPCEIDKLGVLKDCATGTLYDATKKMCDVCTTPGMECVNNTKSVCPFSAMYDPLGKAARCLECTDTHICVYSKTGDDLAPDTYCYAKDPSWSASSLLIPFKDSNRMPFYTYQYCIDCNHKDGLNQLCTFATNYFLSQPGANLTCPAERSVVHEVTIGDKQYLDTRFWDLSNSPYPYCEQNLDLYWPQFSTRRDTGKQCLPLLEYMDDSYVELCKPQYPGFSTPPADKTLVQGQSPADTPLADTYSILEQSIFGTKTVMQICGKGLTQVTIGAGSEEQACMLEESGVCSDPNSAYCHGGIDYKCQPGFQMKTSGSLTQVTWNDCGDVCDEGSYCENGYTGECELGRFCPYGTESKTQYASRPGKKITSTSSTDYSAETSCTGSYCPPVSSETTQAGQHQKSCPEGYHMSVTSDAHNEYNCHPNQPGKVGTIDSTTGQVTSETDCTQGYYCPEGVKNSASEVPCEPGTYGASTGLKKRDECTACSAGKFCAAASTSEGDCAAGFYCLSTSRHPFETACPAGTYTIAGTNAQSSAQCMSCPAGSYCKEGTSLPVTCPTNAYCPANSALFTDCPMNYQLTSGAGATASSQCQACPSGYLCPGGTDPVACPPGTANAYDSANTDPASMVCKLTPTGYQTESFADTAAICADGKYSLQGGTDCFDCPPGYRCQNGVLYECTTTLKYCPASSSTEQSCPDGYLCQGGRQDRQLPCPAGSYCTGGSATSTPSGYFNVQGESAYAANTCGNGYTCTGGAIGPYQNVCPAGTWVGNAENTCSICSKGKYCPIGSGFEIDCPLGYYCDGSVYMPIMCPKGTYGATTNLQAVTDCTSCPAGKKCSQPGLTAPDGDCDAGYYCKGGSWTPRPDESDPAEAATGGYCPAGAYCPQGMLPQNCPAGTYNSFPGMRAATDCISCTPGYYCSGSQNSQPSGMCTAGYYCTSGSDTPTQNMAVKGYYTIAGSSAQIKCAPGYYSDTDAATICNQCPAGKYCEDLAMIAGNDCPAGYYCPLGSVRPTPCPIGTFNSETAKSGSTACTPCTAGKYCAIEGLTAESGDCAAGYFCLSSSPAERPLVNLTALGTTPAVSTFGLCPQGHYCDVGTSNPAPCDIGYYLDAEGATAQSQCIKCPPGQYCDVIGLPGPKGKCPAGFYCPEGSTSPTANPCPAGSKCVQGSAVPVPCEGGTSQPFPQQFDCLACSAGYYCPPGSQSQVTCPAGAYCLAGSAFPTLCPQGTVNLLTGSTNSAACLTCPVDKFCKIAGAGSIAADGIGYGFVLDGYKNTAGGSTSSIPPTSDGSQSYCDRGYTCVGGVMTACTAGKYCEDFELTLPTGNCYQGYYCQAGSKTKTPVTLADDKGARCPAANYCEAGTVTPTPCPVGTYSNGIGLFSLADCNACPPGFACQVTGTTDSTMVKCNAGLYCQGSVSDPALGTPCLPGYQCPQGSASPTPCAPGYFSTLSGSSSCTMCEIGTYCSYKTITPEVPADGYIANSKLMPAPIPCPPGQYKAYNSHSACTDCPEGYFCPDYGMQGPQDTSSGPLSSDYKCPEGYYCPAKTSDYQVYACTPGYYCPLGSKQITPCDAGKYCQGYYLATYTGNCEAGYLCLGKASKPNPDEGDGTGYQCPTGNYCLQGALTATKCPIGTYNDKSGASSDSYCLPCPSGKVCETEGLSTPTTACEAGYYCESVNGVPVKTPCEPGYACPANALAKQKCVQGTYQDQAQQISCLTCPQGKYCYEENGAPVISPQDCPEGFYCPAGTSHYGFYYCPVGTFNDAKNRFAQSSACKSCPYGYRCNRPAMPDFNLGDNYCISGYTCAAGSKAATSTECPQNQYCVNGVDKSCPLGKYGSTPGLADASECTDCTPGYMCPTFNSNQLDCPAGYYCPGGVSRAFEADGTCATGHVCPIRCPKGSYCPIRSIIDTKCPPGYYQDQEIQDSCKICPAGKYCPDSGVQTLKDCPLGKYCPEGSIVPTKCPIGQYPSSGSVCSPCPAGEYCWPEQVILPDSTKLTISRQGACESGYVCQSGSYSPMPQDGTQSMNPTLFTQYNGPVYRGYYSDDGMSNTECPEGTYQPSFYAQECIPCQAGSYCPNKHMGRFENTNYLCPAGKQCDEGISDYNSVSNCPVGYVSEIGSPHCMQCADGYFSDNNPQRCIACPQGSFCNSLSLVPQKCLQGINCKGGDPVDPPCDEGTFLSTVSGQCQSCDPGTYCTGGTKAGLCTAGHLCARGSSTPVPDTMCSPGYYCPHGTSSPTQCPTGYYRSTRGGIQYTDCASCEPGFICSRGADPQECPKGFYCPVGTSSIIPCPAGTYGDKTRLISQTECTYCPAGYICNAVNATDFKKYPCPKGSYCNQKALFPTPCPGGTFRSQTGGKSLDDCSVCPEGFYCQINTTTPLRCPPGTDCPEGTKYYKTCPGGYYCNNETNNQAILCPANYFCPRGSQQPKACSGREICPEGSEIPQLCGAGYYVKSGGDFYLNTCEACPAGTFSTVYQEGCQPCTAGYLCYGRTNRWNPTDESSHRGALCPKGYYCPTGSYNAIPCPEGTYNPDFGASNQTQCLLCKENTFNDRTGQEGCRPCGAYASSDEGARTCKCKGLFRTFSFADSSCRCMSGYEYVDGITGQSKGQESGTENCNPLVFDRCDGTNQTRSATGACVDINDCSAACGGSKGTRSLTLGVCSCENQANVDLVCSQNCRSNAPKLGLIGGTTINMTLKNATTGKASSAKAIDLSKIGDVYGTLTCDDSTANCDIKSAEMGGSGGFYGKYGAPAIVETAVNRLRMLEEEFEQKGLRLLLDDTDSILESDQFRRQLATAEVDYTKNALRNPVVCVAKGDSMLFTIRDPRHYPVYLKDSVMNSNPSFDYGQFLILADQMNTKASKNSTAPSIFAFTFTDKGSYVFVDSSDSEQLMIVRVTGSGESCPDPDRFIQSLSADSAASSGISQKSDIIIKPDVPLLIGMGSILVVSLISTMIGVGYCLHKGWSLPKVNLRGFRNLYMKVDVDHTCEETFRKKNDFSLFKSHLGDPKKDDPKSGDELIDYEDDLDELNLNIHFDVLQAGEEYLKIFDNKKHSRALEKQKRKGDVIKLMQEIEQLINTIGTDAMVHQMQIYKEGEDQPNLDEDGSPIKNESKNNGANDDDKSAEEERKKKMQEGWSDRDKQLLDEAKEQASKKMEQALKLLHSNVSGSEEAKPGASGVAEAQAFALYDGGDAKSRHNQLVRQIESNPNLSDQEKEALLRAHNQSLQGIEDMLQADKKRQEAELERAIKERAERRRKALEQKYKKEINQETREGEQAIKDEIERRKVETVKSIDKEIESRLEEAAKGDKAAYKRSVDELKKERTDRKNQANETLNKEQEARCQSLREQVLQKWTQQAVNSEQDLDAILSGGQPDLNDALNALKKQKESEENALQAKLAERRKRLKTQLKEEKAKIDEEIKTKDPLVEEEFEAKKNQIFQQANRESGSRQDLALHGSINLQASILGPNGSIDKIAAPNSVQQQQEAANASAKAKQEQEAQFQKLLNGIDTQLQASQLLEALRNSGQADPDLIEKLMKQEEEEQQRKLNDRRELLRQRKALKKQQELEQVKITEQLQILQEEDQERAKIGKTYIKDMFAQLTGKDISDPSQGGKQQEKLVVFNEYSSDAMLQRLSNLLMKQFVEKEAALKLLVQKYMDARLIEKTHIKKQFKTEYEKLADLQQSGLIEPEALKEAQKALRLKEENLLREVDLQFDKAQKEEELKLRSDMEKRHADDQINLRKQELEEQLKLKKELNLTAGATAAQAQKDEELDRLSLRAFEEQKKREQERKQRAIGIQKQEIARQIDKELKNKYSDYEELLKRKRDEEAALQDTTLSIRKKLQDRKRQLKDAVSQFSEQELKNMKERAFLQLQTLETVYEEERRRQQLMMNKRIAQKRVKMEKQKLIKDKVDAHEVDQIKNKLLADTNEDKTVDFMLIELDEEKDTPLMRMLREWMRRRQELKKEEETRQLAETVIDLDPITIKRLIMKLDNLEKGLRELRRLQAIKLQQNGLPLNQPQSSNIKEFDQNEEQKKVQSAKAPTPVPRTQNHSPVPQAHTTQTIVVTNHVREIKPSPKFVQQPGSHQRSPSPVPPIKLSPREDKVHPVIEGPKKEKPTVNPFAVAAHAVGFATAPKSTTHQAAPEMAQKQSPPTSTIVSPRDNHLRSSIKSDDKKTPRSGSRDPNDKEYMTVIEGGAMKKEDYTKFKKFVKKR